jgi:phage-related protein
MSLPVLDFLILRDVVAEPIERVKIAQFADGYSDPKRSGINPVVERWTLKIVIKPVDFVRFQVFISAVGKTNPFEWISPHPTNPTVKKWFIKEYSYEYRDRENNKDKEWIWTLKIEQTFNYG